MRMRVSQACLPFFHLCRRANTASMWVMWELSKKTAILTTLIPSHSQGLINGVFLLHHYYYHSHHHYYSIPHNIYPWPPCLWARLFPPLSSCFSGHYLGNLCYPFDTFTNSKLGGGGVNLTSYSYLFISWIPLAQTQAWVWEFPYPIYELLSKRAG